MGYTASTFIGEGFVKSAITLSFAIVPILWLLVSIGVFRLSAYKACIAGLSLSLAIATTFFQMPYRHAFQAILEGAVLALLPILWVIFAGFYTYNISLETGAMDVIKRMLSNLSGDRRIQTLAIAWGFGGFLESVAGFGTAVAIPASILISLGFKPFFSALICLFANTIAVAFGVVGIPVTTLAKVTELPAMTLSLDIALQLTPLVILVPFLLIFKITESLAGFKGIWITTLVAGLSFGLSQFLVAKYIGPELPAIIGSAISFGAIVLCARKFPPAKEWRFPYEETARVTCEKTREAGTFPEQIIAWMPYLLLLLLVLGTSKLWPQSNEFFSRYKSVVSVYDGAGSKPLYIDWILTPGTLIMVSAIIGGLIQGISPRNLVVTLVKTLLSLKKTAMTVISIVSMAKVLSYSGMVGSIAAALAESTGSFYPVFAPLIGALGTFITGSDTSANVLFGALQRDVALKIGADPAWIAAANTSGACAGKLISPQSIAIAVAATGLSGREGELLGITIKYVCVFIAVLGIITYTFV